MRKTMMILVLSAMIFAACGNSGQQSEPSTDADGNSIITNDSFTTIYADQLPCSLPYNDKELIVQDFGVYQTTVDYEHILYAIATIDASALSDEDFHWMNEDDDIDAYVGLDGGQNELSDTAIMSRLGWTNYTDSKSIKICWVEGLSQEYREPFDSTEVKFTVEAKQKDGKPIQVYYTPDTETIPEVSELSGKDRDFLEENIND